MGQNLVNSRFNIGMIQNILQVMLIEVGNPNCPQFTSLIGIFQCPLSFKIAFFIAVIGLVDHFPWLWTVNDHQIDVIQA